MVLLGLMDGERKREEENNRKINISRHLCVKQKRPRETDIVKRIKIAKQAPTEDCSVNVEYAALFQGGWQNTNKSTTTWAENIHGYSIMQYILDTIQIIC